MATTIHPGMREGQQADVTNKKYKFDIYADDSGGKVEFYMQPGDQETWKHLEGKRLEFPNGTDWYDIEYNLKDKFSSVKVKFKTAEPICIQPGSVCPAKGSGNGSGGEVSVTSKSDKKLDVQNTNQTAGLLSYTLFFTDMNDQDVGEVDPIYDNGGGGHPLR